MSTTTRDACLERDRDDGLAPLRHLFEIPPGRVYLDGNSLGVLPRETAPRLEQVVREEWGRGLIGSWNGAGWIEWPERLGDKIARLVGARAGEVVAADSTSVNLFKLLSAAALRCTGAGRRVLLSERSNFPTDLYIAESVCARHGLVLELADEPEAIEPRLARGDVALLMLTQVNYRTGRLHDMAALTRAAHAAGALVLWDLAHSAGALPVDLHAADADYAVGCGYKYLNGGPGAPAFLWAHPRHVASLEQPLSGWMGHAAPFDFAPAYRPAPGIARALCGTPPILALAALECGLDTLLAAEPLGGMAAIRRKSLALTGLFIELVEARCAGVGLALVTPREEALRGSQVCFARAEGGYEIVQALIARGVVGDFRAGDPARQGIEAQGILRFGFTPLYTAFAEVWDAVEQLRQVLASGEWREPRFARQGRVT